MVVATETGPVGVWAVGEVLGSLPSVVYLAYATPDPFASSTVAPTSTGEVTFQPAALGAGVVNALIVGGVLSTTMPTLASASRPWMVTVCGPSLVPAGIVSENEAVPRAPAFAGDAVSGTLSSRV